MLKTRWLIAVLGLASFANAWAASKEEAAVEALFQSYWTATKEGEYEDAAKMILPSDAAELAAGLKPVLLTALKNPKPETAPLARFLTDGLPPERLDELRPMRLVARIHELAMSSNPKFAELAKRSSIKITSTKVSRGKTAKMDYQIVVDAEAVDDKAEFAKVKDAWYLKLDDKPSDTIAEFKKALGQ